MKWADEIKKHYADEEAEVYGKMTWGVQIYVDDWKQIGESLFYEHLHAYMLGRSDKSTFITFMTDEGISPLDMGDVLEWADSHDWNREWDTYAQLVLSA